MILMETALCVRENNTQWIAAASSKFGRFRPETEEKIREHQARPSPVLEDMKKAWAACEEIDHNNYDMSISRMLIAKNPRFSAKDIEVFSIALAGFQDEEHFPYKAGLFLSALINRSEDSEFVIHTSHLSKPVNTLGYRNTKNIAVDGDVGHGVGSRMKDGSITIDGNADNKVGQRMGGGIIAVAGKAGDSIGHEMTGGIITVGGDAGESVGGWMQNGAITVRGYVGPGAGKYMRAGTIRIGGDAGDSVGTAMSGGTIIVEGGAGDWAGSDMVNGTIIVGKGTGSYVGYSMKGGAITVNGNACVVGWLMNSGTITIEGNAGEKVGYCMSSGEIYLAGGSFALSDDIRGGKIFHNGELVFPK